MQEFQFFFITLLVLAALVTNGFTLINAHTRRKKFLKIRLIYAEVNKREALIVYWFFTSPQSPTAAVRRMRKPFSSESAKGLKKTTMGGNHDGVF
jgi:hypothetical protein